MIENFFFNLWYKKRNVSLKWLFIPFMLIYFVAWLLRDLFIKLFNYGVDLGCPVISIGNITVGGTGKTPFLLYLLKKAQTSHEKIVVLTRGYKGRKEGVVADEFGFPDEARLIKKQFPAVVVLAGKRRYENYRRYIREKGIPELVILDDGFQHRKIKRHTDIVMFDNDLLFGNKLLLPAGPLREPIFSVNNRAHFVIIKDGTLENYKMLKGLFSGKTVLTFNAKNIFLKDLRGVIVNKDTLFDKKIVAFCGIGNPESFKKSLDKVSIKPELLLTFGDHHDYHKGDIEKIKSYRADFYITTEKDAVKLDELWEDRNTLLISVVEYELNEEDIVRLLKI